MRTRAKKNYVAGDRARRENEPRHNFFMLKHEVVSKMFHVKHLESKSIFIFYLAAVIKTQRDDID